MKRRVSSALENQTQSPGFVFNEKVDQINTSNHYSAKALTPADVGALDLREPPRPAGVVLAPFELEPCPPRRADQLRAVAAEPRGESREHDAQDERQGGERAESRGDQRAAHERPAADAAAPAETTPAAPAQETAPAAAPEAPAAATTDAAATPESETTNG